MGQAEEETGGDARQSACYHLQERVVSSPKPGL